MPHRSSRLRTPLLTLMVLMLAAGALLAPRFATAADYDFGQAYLLAHGSSSSSVAEAQRQAQPRIVGGTALASTQSAPYTVAVQTRYDAGTLGACSGTIIDAVHVLTAAHCVVKGDLRATPDHVLVAAGSVDLISPTGRAAATIAPVAAIRVHPHYRYPKDPSNAKSYADDVAVLTLGAPLDLSGPAIQALPMAPIGAYVGATRRVRVTGFGISSALANDFGTMRSVLTSAVTAGQCGIDAPAAMLCTYRQGHAACEGDSGGTATVDAVSTKPKALTRGASTRFLVGVTNIAARDCAAGLNLFANVTAPEVRAFIDAAVAEQDLATEQIAVSPRGGRGIRVTGTVRTGRIVRCSRGRWSGSPQFRYSFFRIKGAKERETKLSAKSRYRLRSADRGWRVGCAVVATNPGGTGVSLTRTVRTVR